MMSGSNEAQSLLWVNRQARFSGVERLLGNLGKQQYAPYLFVLLVLSLDFILLSGIGSYWYGYTHPFFLNPFLILSPLGLWFAIWMIRRIARSYEDMAKIYESDNRLDSKFSMYSTKIDIRKSKSKHFLLIGMVLFHFSNIIISGTWMEIFAIEGHLIGAVKFFVIVPLGYFPIIAELGGLVLSSLLLVPRFLVKYRYRLQFDDPLNIGGLKPAGELIKNSVYTYNLGIIVLILWVYGPFIFTQFADTNFPAPTSNELFFLIFSWVVGTSSLLYGIFKLHFYMREKKLEKIREIDQNIRELGDEDYGIPNITISDEETRIQLEYEYLRMEKVEKMRTWPFTVAAQEQMLFSVLLPLFLDRLLNYLLF